MSTKIVVATHPMYTFALNFLLSTLDYKNHLDDTIVAVADVPKHLQDIVVTYYKSMYGLKYVICHHSNNYEYTSFVSVANAMEKGETFGGCTNFFFIHDTTAVEPAFWGQLAEIAKNELVNNSDKVWFPMADNFNMGLAKPEFLRDYVYPQFKDTTMTKEEAVSIEIDTSNPLNFQAMCKNRWVHLPIQCDNKFLCARPWSNDTDVYGDGVLRCVVKINEPGMYKFCKMITEITSFS
jgi:hypothetical protein